MSVVRTQKAAGNFVMLDKTALNDQRLSWKAKGLHAFMMSRPDHWEFYMKELEDWAKDGRESLQNAMKELEKTGYVTRARKKDDQGKICGWETIVHEVPADNQQTAFPSNGKTVGRENRLTGKPSDGKPATSNNKYSNNKHSNNDLSKTTPTPIGVETNLDSGGGFTSQECFDFYQQNIGVVSPFLSQQLENDVNDYGHDLVMYALKQMVLNGKRNYKYAQGILKRLSADGITTVEQIENQQRATTKQQNSGGWEDVLRKDGLL